MKDSKGFIGSQGQLFDENRPILEYLIPVRIEDWRQEGLFTHSKNYSPWRKARFCMMIRAKAFNFISKDSRESRSSTNISPVEMHVAKLMDARRILQPVQDKNMRVIMEQMIVVEVLHTAHNMAKKVGMRFPQFKDDFNKGLEQAMDAWYLSHNKRKE